MLDNRSITNKNMNYTLLRDKEINKLDKLEKAQQTGFVSDREYQRLRSEYLGRFYYFQNKIAEQNIKGQMQVILNNL